MTQKLINAVMALGLGVALVLGFAGINPPSDNLGGAGAYEALQTWFGNGIYAGTAKQFALDSAGKLTTSAQVGVGTTSPSSLGDIVADGSATTTLMLSSSGTGGSCLQLENSAGTQTKAYIAGTAWVIAAGACK
jgi:hypothetical protein